MRINKGIKFLLHIRHKGDSKNLSIRMRVTLRGQKPVDFPTGHSVNLEDWDADNQCVKPDADNAEEINQVIGTWRSVINEMFARYELLEKRIPSPEEVKELFNDMVGRKTKVTEILDDDDNVFKVFDKFVSYCGEKNSWSNSTYVKFRSIRKHLLEFDPHMKFSQVNDLKMQKYTMYLERFGLKNTTISKNLSFVRWFFRWAAQNGYYQGNIQETFKPKLKGTSVDSKEIIFLTQEEVHQLQNHHFTESQNALERVCDVFLFQCFTGLRYSDVSRLHRSDIVDGKIHIVTQKTVDGLQIELNRHSQAILDKYKDYLFPKDLALPIISNQKMNEALKEIGQICEINQPTRIVYFKGNQRIEEVYPKWALLTTHCARRTFVVMALQLGIPVEVIIRWTGHSDYKSMKPYIKIVDELKAMNMNLFNSI